MMNATIKKITTWTMTKATKNALTATRIRSISRMSSTDANTSHAIPTLAASHRTWKSVSAGGD
jgi:hypothetical protein